MTAITAPKPGSIVNMDRPRRLRFTWSAANRFEEAYGKTIIDALTQSAGTRFFTYLAWAGLLHENGKITLSEVERRFDRFLENGGKIEALADELLKALTDSGVIGAKKEEDEEEPEGEVPAVPEEE